MRQPPSKPSGTGWSSRVYRKGILTEYQSVDRELAQSMKEYHFQFTKPKDVALVMLACLIVFTITTFIGAMLSIGIILLVAIEIPLMFMTFRLLKKRAVSICTAKLSDNSVDFEFENESKTINFSDLISFKAYYGKNGPILYLKSHDENFKIFANNNFCKTEDFCSFSIDTIKQLDDFKKTYNSDLIHEGSIFATKGMFYFLIIATLIYLAAFFFETNALRIAIGIGGGLFFGIMWIRYFIETDKKPG
jgi:hypothetical protein